MMVWLLYALCAIYAFLAIGGLNHENGFVRLTSGIALLGIAAAAYLENWWIWLATFVVDHVFQAIQKNRGGARRLVLSPFAGGNCTPLR